MDSNNQIGKSNQYNPNDDLVSQSQKENRLNQLRETLSDQLYNYNKEIREAEYDEDMANLRKLYNLKVKYATEADKKQKTIEDKYNKRLEAAEKKLAADEFKKYEEKLKKKKDAEITKITEVAAARAKAEEQADKRSKAKETIKSGETTLSEKLTALGDYFKSGGFTDALSGIAQKLSNQVDEIAGYQSRWNTRLQGTGKTFENNFSRYGISSTLQGVVGMSPLVTLKDVMKNTDSFISQGIAYNVEQRAFLETISDKIADTFEAANGTLLQLVRIQQQDTTAARLGMEASLTSFLNNMYENTEYLNSLSATVSSNLYEATSLLGAKAGVGVEYQVQKWLGSLYSVGMSSTSISNIASALGMLGSGDIRGLTSSSMQNLLVKSAQKANLSYVDLLKGGLTSDKTNALLESMVEYLSEIASSDDNVVRAQLASVFGITASDLKAATNLASSLTTVAGKSLNYSDAINTLVGEANTMYSRTSVGEMMSNIWNNIQYGLSTGIASNPALYALLKVSNALESTVGGIAIPTVSVAGTSVALNTTVADLMKVGALSGSLLSSIGTMINTLGSGSALGFSGAGMLSALGIKKNGEITTVDRGTGLDPQLSGLNKSLSSVYKANTSGSDIYDTSMAGVTDTKKQLAIEAKDESASVTLDTVDEHVSGIFDLLKDISTGAKSLTVNYAAGSFIN